MFLKENERPDLVPLHIKTLMKRTLSIKQHGSLRYYQREFERLANKVIRWPHKALIATFLGGLKTEIAM
jgi:hypothetical protein